MNNHAKEIGVPSSRRLSRGQVNWPGLIFVGIFVGGVTILGTLGTYLRFSGECPKTEVTWEVQTLPVKDDEVMCYILTTPTGAVDLECIPYYYEVEETQDEYETRT